MNAMPSGAPPGEADALYRKPSLRLVRGLVPSPPRPAPDIASRPAPDIRPQPVPDIPPRLAPDIRPRPRLSSPPGPALDDPPGPALDLPPRAARSSPPRPAQQAPLRLTRRGRVVVATLAALAVMALSLFAARAAQAAHGSAPPRHDLVQVTVRPGQSLWSVAESADPGQDTRLVIKQIIDLNSLGGDTVFAGQQLWVPRG